MFGKGLEGFRPRGTRERGGLRYSLGVPPQTGTAHMTTSHQNSLRFQAIPKGLSKATMLLAGGLLLGACTETDENNSPFIAKTVTQSVASSSVVVVTDRYMAYAASELGTGSGGTDFNGDSDTADDVVTIVNLSNDEMTPLSVALKPGVGTSGFTWLNDVLFFVVSEATDSRDWNGDMDMLDDVLVYWFPGQTAATTLATLGDDAIFANNNSIIYTSTRVPAVVGDTNLTFAQVLTDGAAPSAPQVMTTPFVDPGNDGITMTLHSNDNGVVVMSFSEVDEGGDVNGDLDMLDANILALFGTGSGGQAQVIGQALDAGSLTAKSITTGADRLVAYWVDEAGEGANLNDPSLFNALWQPTQCSGSADVDMLDQVLHWLNLTDFTADSMMNAPVNTGLVGDGQIYNLGDMWLGVVSRESDEGGCDLNQDTDSADEIFRWVETTADPLPVGDVNKLIALDTGVAGGSGGVVTLNDALWVTVVDEAADGRNYDGSSNDNEFFAVLDPALVGTSWNFDQGGNSFVKPSWMVQDPNSSIRFLAAITEASTNSDSNTDGDTLDSIPVFAREGGAARELDFPGVGVAVEATNPGIITSGDFGFYRISESDQGFDYNLDGDLNDEILQRVNLTGSEPATSMGVIDNSSDRVILVGTGVNPRGIIWVAPEAQQGASGLDFNGDGDTNDMALRYSRLP